MKQILMEPKVVNQKKPVIKIEKVNNLESTNAEKQVVQFYQV